MLPRYDQTVLPTQPYHRIIKVGFTDEEAQLRQKMDELISESEQDEWNAHLEMINMNSKMMCDLYKKPIY